MDNYTPTKVTYCTPEDVAMTLDLPDPNDHYSTLQFSDVSHPSDEQVRRMIKANEDIIDRRMRRTWRENYVKDQLLTIQEYWADINGWRSDYYQRGGHYVQLRKDIRAWDPEPRFSDTLEDKRIESDEVAELTAHIGEVVDVHGVTGLLDSVDTDDGENYVARIYRKIWDGDRLEVRTRGNTWSDISGQMDPEERQSHDSTYCFFDYPYGKLYLRTRLYQQKANALRISYRYGSTEEPPEAIKRLCCLLTAIQVLNMQVFSIKIGSSGDLGQIRSQYIQQWQDEINTIYSSFQRSGSVHAMWS